MNDKWYLPDILKDYPRMMERYAKTMGECCQPFGLVNSNNKLGGVFFMSDITPEHEGVFYCWLWDKSCYTPTTHRFMLGYIEHLVEEFGLCRVVCRTPDEQGLGRLLERLFFKLEGRFRSGYKHGGRLYTMFCYRRLFA